MRRTACSCGRSSAATTMMTCQCLRPCSWRKVRYIELNPAPRFRTAVWPCSTRDGASQSTAAGAQEPSGKRQQQLLPRSGPETQLPAGRPQVKPPPTPTGSPLYWRGSEVYLFPVCALLLCVPSGRVLIPTESDSVIGWWLGDVTTQGAMGPGRENVTGI